MGGIKSKIFSDWSLENPDLETDLTADEKSKMMITSEKLNLNDFEYYVIDQDDQGVNQNQTLNEQTYSTKFIESGTVKVQVKKIDPPTIPSSYSRATKSLKEISLNSATMPLTNFVEEEYNKIQQKKLRDHSLFDTTQLELNKGIIQNMNKIKFLDS